MAAEAAPAAKTAPAAKKMAGITTTLARKTAKGAGAAGPPMKARGA